MPIITKGNTKERKLEANILIKCSNMLIYESFKTSNLEQKK